MKNGDKNEKEDESSPALAVAAALDGGGEGAGGGAAVLCLRAEQSSGLWTARNVAIEKITLAAVKNGDKNEKEDESSPALVVAAALDGGGEGAGGGGALLCLRAEQSSGPWTARNVAIEKITLAAVKNGDKNEKEDEYSPALVVGAALDGGGEGAGGGTAILCLWAEQSSGPRTVGNILIEKIN